ncbi:MAG TPA: A/G-specific adenine glycosylase [Ktedonobacterales bacterium]
MTHPAMERRAEVWAALLAWYRAEGRHDLPWRQTRDPYAILVSEVMLQQTQVERVQPRYLAFLARFPTLRVLADASRAEVIQAWAGLGYNLRAVRLHEIAQQAVASPDGALPGTLDGLLRLKGIGRYTAGAVACFAFGLQVATVDTNIRRVLWRVFRGIEPATWPGDQQSSRILLELAEWALPPGEAYDWQQALMELGARICVARRPRCEQCPLATYCAALAETGEHTLFPSGEALERLRHERAIVAGTLAEEPASYTVAGSPARRKAERFEESSRYFRGRVVATLRELGPGEMLALRELGPRVKPAFMADDEPWLRGLVSRLARDGLVSLSADGERVSLPR